MATKSPETRRRIPSVSELLETPAVRAVSERWNRSVVATGLRSFLEELRDDLAQRASKVELPSLHELAERAARHLAQRRGDAIQPAINATGRLLGSDWLGQPLAEAAWQRLAGLGSEFLRSGLGDRQADSSYTQSLATKLARLTGAEAATFVHSYRGAIGLTLSALSSGKGLLVARGELGDVDSGCSLATLASSSTALLREVGATNRTTAHDFESQIDESSAAVLRHFSDHYRIAGQTESPDRDELVALCRDREVLLVHAAGTAPLVDGMPMVDAAIGSIAGDVAAGVHVVIARGDGLVGGPPCGLIVGTRDLVRRIETHPLFPGWQIDPLRAAAFEATLEAYDDPPRLAQSLPLYQLLTTPIDNLRLRAERLAPQLAQAQLVATAEAVATENSLGIDRWEEIKLPSFGIALSAAAGDLRNLLERLQSAPVPIIARVDGQRLILDLRTVFPRQEQPLVEAIADRPIAPSQASEPVGEVAARPAEH